MKNQRSLLAVVIAFIALTLAVGTGAQKSAGTPDKAYMQKIWDGWSTLNPDNVAQFYASGSHAFFDIAPLKYNGWDEYQSGVRKVLADYKSAKFTVNDDAELHAAGKYFWGTATVKFEMTHRDGKVDMGNMRWTVVFDKQGTKWLTVHEHVSVPMG
jgi:ketosteroid isomerase-like protein